MPCPAFNDPEFVSWFPYLEDQQIVFRNNSSTDSVTISQVSKSEGYEASKGCYGGESGCNTDYGVYSAEPGLNFNPKLQLTYLSRSPFESTTHAKNIYLKFYNFSCNANGITNEGLQVGTGVYSGQYFPSLNLGGNVFSKVQVIVKDTSNTINKIAGPYKIYLAKSIGIVGYEEYPVLRTWVKE